ncbi:group 1 glycosyl transferase [Natrinema versiforme JCM 10478]|uniref:Group 1 glycosyl transferase n=2 Tax=Natrinema versiforme TaxID=88724 RepID=L9XZ07_9EURY|nr:group 1 glycosyl transferase [Natrinema versiforme JCM 10478]
MLEHSDCLQEHADKCTVIPLSVDLETFGGNTPSVDLPIDERPTLLFVGRLTYYKGVDRLIDAVVDIDANVLLVGDGNQRESLERRVRDLGISDRVQFLGRVDDRTLHACYDAADVFVLPSVAESEAFGIVQLEAMAYGTPVINTDLPTGVPWVSRDGKTGVTVPPDDSEALADAIAVLLDDPKRRATYGEAARRRVEAEFSRERMLERTEELYDRLLNKGEWL